jgi:hypothetical protein
MKTDPLEVRLTLSAVNSMRSAAFEMEDISRKIELLESAAHVAKLRIESSEDSHPVLNFIYGQVLLDLAKYQEQRGKSRSGLTRLYFREVGRVYGAIVGEGKRKEGTQLPSEDALLRAVHADAFLIRMEYLKSVLYAREGHLKIAAKFAQNAYFKGSNFLEANIPSRYLQGQVREVVGEVIARGNRFKVSYAHPQENTTPLRN